MKTEETISAKRLKLGVILLVASLLSLPVCATAQEDVTPPVLLDFMVTPIAFDTGPAPVSIEWCARARDDLSGIRGISLVFGLQGGTSTVSGITFPPGTLEGSGCAQFVVSQFSRYGTYLLGVTVNDAFNLRYYWNPLIQSGGPEFIDLCTFQGAIVCTVENRPSDGLPDADGDGIADDSDNCPSDFNPNQEDQDLDLIGDVCDPFPDDLNNELAQCRVDLTNCYENPTFPDEDSDGEANSTDLCPDTPPGAAVDQAGCSLAQFCSSIDSTKKVGRQICERSDWKNDEPLSNLGDCKVVRQGSTNKCVPR